MELAQLIVELANLDVYPAHPGTIELRQTHISVVCLTEHFVYKIRKPVQFSFLDFSTIEKRRADCEREVVLNQRLSSGVYVGIVPLVSIGGRMYFDESYIEAAAIDAGAEVIDWAVKMHRLPDAATLKARLLRNEVSPELIVSIGHRMAEFHRNAAGGPEIARYGRFEQVSKNLLENLDFVGTEGPSALSTVMQHRLHKVMHQRLNELQELIDGRAAEQVPRDTHGDLRLDHIYLLPEREPPADLCIIDCIEFNDSFRYADPVADIAFLIMELKFYGHPDLADVLTTAYFQNRGDDEGRRLLSLYVAYRSAVRAKVASLEAIEPELTLEKRSAAAARSLRHWFMVLRELEAPSCRPGLILIGGLQGTGKSTLARSLGEAADFTVIRSDVVRKELALGGATNAERLLTPAAIYTDSWTERTYQQCLDQTLAALHRGERVIVDATFSRECQRLKFLDAAERLGIPVLLVICRAEPEVIHERLDARSGDASDADWNVYLAAVEKWEPLSERALHSTFEVETSRSMDEPCGEIISALQNVGLLYPQDGNIPAN